VEESPGRRVVVAIGGNAIVKETEEGTVYQQFANTRATVRGVAQLIEAGQSIVLTHGNGPQVGNILIRVYHALGKAYFIPVGVAVAESQGEMGYMIAQTLHNRMILDGMQRPVASVLTQVICSPDDPALKNPTKPVGPFYTLEEAETLRASGFRLMEDSGRGYRVVVPSPRPNRIVEKESILVLLEAGVVVIAAGGGGMPVFVQSDGTLEGIDGVVDKDLASSLLGKEIGAKELIILTGVPEVYVDYRTPRQTALREVRIGDLRRYQEDGQFPVGSMGPKIEAAIEFLEAGGERVLVTSADYLVEAYFRGGRGTWIVP
jgi:carbamate kinase